MVVETSKLLRDADINGIGYPLYIKSFYFEFFLDSVKIKVYGDMQYKINDWAWGDKLEFTPDYVNVIGVKIAVVPLQVKYEIYRNLGWNDRVEKINQVFQKSSQAKGRQFYVK